MYIMFVASLCRPYSLPSYAAMPSLSVNGTASYDFTALHYNNFFSVPWPAQVVEGGEEVFYCFP